MDFNKYYKTSKKVSLINYARKVPNLIGKYYRYSDGMDNYDKPANCTIRVSFVDYNNTHVTPGELLNVYAPSIFNRAHVTLAYNPYKDYMFEIWNNTVFLKGKRIDKIPGNMDMDQFGGQHKPMLSDAGYNFLKEFKFFDPFASKKIHDVALISDKELKNYREKLDKSLDVLIHDYVETYPLKKSDPFHPKHEQYEYKYPVISYYDRYENKYLGFPIHNYTDKILQEDLEDNVLGKFDNTDALKDFLIRKNLKSKKTSQDEQLIEVIEDYFVRTHIMKLGDTYYIDYYCVFPSGDKYSKPLSFGGN